MLAFGMFDWFHHRYVLIATGTAARHNSARMYEMRGSGTSTRKYKRGRPQTARSEHRGSAWQQSARGWQGDRRQPAAVSRSEPGLLYSRRVL